MAQLTYEELAKSRIWIGKNPDLSKKVQERLFELGFKWGKNEKTVQYTDQVSLYLWPDGSILYSAKDTELGKLHTPHKYKEIHLWDLGLDKNGDYNELIGLKVKIGGESPYKNTFGQTLGETGIIVGLTNTKSPLVYQPGIESTTSVYSPYVSYCNAREWIIDGSPKEDKIKSKIKINTKGLKRGDYIEYDKKRGKIVGFLSHGAPIIDMDEGDGGHDGIINSGDSWYDEEGEVVPYIPGKNYRFVNGEAKKIDPPKEKIHPDAKFRPGMEVYSEEYKAPCTIVAFTDRINYSDNVLVEFESCDNMSYENSIFYDDYGNEMDSCKWRETKFQVQCQHELEELVEKKNKIKEKIKPSKWKYKVGDTVWSHRFKLNAKVIRVESESYTGTLPYEIMDKEKGGLSWHTYNEVEDPHLEVATTTINTGGFHIGERVRFDIDNKEGIIRGFHKDKERDSCVIERLDGNGHYGDTSEYWYDENGRSIFNTRENKDCYYYITFLGIQHIENPSTEERKVIHDYKYKIGDKVLYWKKTPCVVVGYDIGGFSPNYFLAILDSRYGGSCTPDIGETVVDQYGDRVPNKSGKFTWAFESSITPIKQHEGEPPECNGTIPLYTGGVDLYKEQSNCNRLMRDEVVLAMLYSPLDKCIAPEEPSKEFNLIPPPPVPPLISFSDL